MLSGIALPGSILTKGLQLEQSRQGLLYESVLKKVHTFFQWPEDSQIDLILKHNALVELLNNVQIDHIWSHLYCTTSK